MFELKSLIVNLEGIGFSIVTWCFDRGIAVFIRYTVCYYDVVIGEETLGIGDTCVYIIFDAKSYLSLWSCENASGGVLLDVNNTKANILPLGFSTAVLFVDFDEILSGFKIGKAYTFEKGQVPPVK